MAVRDSTGSTSKTKRATVAPRTIRLDPIPTAKQARGRQIAIDMITEMERRCVDSEGIVGQGSYCLWEGDIDDAGYCAHRDREGPQDNIVARVILEMGGDRELINGFGAILSDWISSAWTGERDLGACSPAKMQARQLRIRTWAARAGWAVEVQP